MSTHRIEPVLVGGLPAEAERQDDVLERRDRGDQVERLEDEADLLTTEDGEVLVVERAEVDVADDRLAGREGVEAGDAVHQRRLAGARRAHDRRETGTVELDGHAVEGLDDGVALAVVLHGVDGSGDGGAGGRGGKGGAAHAGQSRPFGGSRHPLG